MTTKKQSYLKIVKDYLPLIYIFLVCFGYFNKSLYFDRFGIDILNFMSIPEMILIFIPLGSMLFTTVVFLIIIFSPVLVFGIDKYESYSENNNDSFEILKRLKKTKNMILKNIFVNTYYATGILVMMYLRLVPMLLFVYISFSIMFEKISYRKNTAFIFFVLWAILFLLKFAFQKKTLKSNPKIVLFVYSILIFIGFFAYTEININKANRILLGKSNYYVKFKINEQIIETNKKLLFFGQTKEYIFLRELETKENFIYNKKNIKELITKEIR